MTIGHVFQITEISTGKIYLEQSTRTEARIRHLFNKRFDPNYHKVKILYTSIGDPEQVRQELKVQFQRFQRQYNYETKPEDKVKPKKPDRRIGKPSPYSKKVLKVDDEGKPRALFNSVTEASRITGCNKSLISKVCNGERDYVEGRDAEGNKVICKFQWYNKLKDN